MVAGPRNRGCDGKPLQPLHFSALRSSAPKFIFSQLGHIRAQNSAPYMRWLLAGFIFSSSSSSTGARRLPSFSATAW